jgi:hypothetical protein
MAEIRISEHPRAVQSIRKAKGWGGLAGFGLVAFVSMQAGTATPDLLLRSLIGGIAGYVLLWTLAVILWRQLALAEVKVNRQKAKAAHEARIASMKEAAAQAGGVGGPANDATMVIR